jgi:hypothetical protein
MPHWENINRIVVLLSFSTEQRPHIILGQGLEETGFSGSDTLHQCALLFLHCIAGDDPVGENGFLPPDVAGAVGG